MSRKKAAAVSSVAALAGVSAALAQQTVAPPAKSVFAADGTVHIPAFELPPSAYLSPEALAAQQARANRPHGKPESGSSDIEAIRQAVETSMLPQVAAARERYPVDIVPEVIGGVKTRIVTPRDGEVDARRVLINLHGGAFTMCEDACGLLESIPIAAVGRYRVITVAYRQAPEHAFPAASEDVAAVYRELLHTYRPENIGIYGCSAGGMLTAQAEAWFQRKGLPNPGALGVFGAGGVPFGKGDSAYLSAFTDGGASPAEQFQAIAGYFHGSNMDDPLVSPALDPQVLARFPPTLFVTGTRAPDMSPAIFTHTRLLKAGIDSQLLVAEGMAHCYIMNHGLPEARDAYDIIVRFFDRHLGTAR